MIARTFLLFFTFSFILSIDVTAQDTLRISYDEFISRVMNSSGQVKYMRENIDLAENRVEQAKAHPA